MRTFTRRAGLLAAGFVMLTAASARAATIEVKVPFPFVVEGRTLPAGQYRVTSDEGLVQFVGEKGTRASLFCLMVPTTGKDPAGQRPALTFVRYEKQYRLTDIWESGTEGLEPIKG